MYLSVIQFQVYVSHLLWPILLLKVCGQNSDVCFHLNACLFDGLLQLWPPSDSISLILDDIKPSKMSSLWEGGIDNIIPSLSLSTETSIKACVISHYLSVFRRMHSYLVMHSLLLAGLDSLVSSMYSTFDFPGGAGGGLAQLLQLHPRHQSSGTAQTTGYSLPQQDPTSLSTTASQ